MWKITIGLEKFLIWSPDAIRLVSVAQDFYCTLGKLNSCFRQMYFSSIICCSSESHKPTWKYTNDVNKNVEIIDYLKELRILHFIIIFFFITDLYKLAFSTYYFKKTFFCALCFLSDLFSTRSHFYRFFYNNFLIIIYVGTKCFVLFSHLK